MIDAKLDPMNHERRLVHTIVSEFDGLLLKVKNHQIVM